MATPPVPERYQSGTYSSSSFGRRRNSCNETATDRPGHAGRGCSYPAFGPGSPVACRLRGEWMCRPRGPAAARHPGPSFRASRRRTGIEPADGAARAPPVLKTGGTTRYPNASASTLLPRPALRRQAMQVPREQRDLPNVLGLGEPPGPALQPDREPAMRRHAVREGPPGNPRRRPGPRPASGWPPGSRSAGAGVARLSPVPERAPQHSTARRGWAWPRAVIALAGASVVQVQVRIVGLSGADTSGKRETRERRRARVVGGRGRLRGVPAQLRRRGRRRRGRPAGAAVPPGVPGRPRRRRRLADSLLPVSAGRRRLRRQRLLRRGPAARDHDRLRPSGQGRGRAPDPDHRRPGAEPLLQRASAVPRRAGRGARQRGAGPVHLPRRARPGRRTAAEQLDLAVRRPGLDAGDRGRRPAWAVVPAPVRHQPA